MAMEMAMAMAMAKALGDVILKKSEIVQMREQ